MIHRTSSIEIDPSSERVAKLFRLGFEYNAQKCVKYDSIRTIISTNVFEEVEGNLVTLTNKYVNQGNAVLYVLDVLLLLLSLYSLFNIQYCIKAEMSLYLRSIGC